MELFATQQRTPPLAWRMQPEDFNDFLGQSHLIGEGQPLRRLIDEDRFVSLIFYGPPGTGKTALAHLIARKTRARFVALNAVTAGVKDIRQAVAADGYAQKTLLFIDEIHRFNKLQQDALLPSVEKGDVTLIGASTYNPAFALVPALSSRSLIFQFRRLSPDDVKVLILRAVREERGLGKHSPGIDPAAVDFIASVCDGDARRALNILELAHLSLGGHGKDSAALSLQHVKKVLQNKTLYYDEDDHYNTISAFIKSMRGSDPDAAVYWMAKMIESGEDPLFIARRIVICAAEDVGNADPHALVLAVSALKAVERIGMPEGRIILSQAALYIAAAPKSNAAYRAIDEAIQAVGNEPVQDVPDHLKDSSYPGAGRLGHGSGYLYPHDYPRHYVDQNYMEIKKEFYKPSDEGFEKVIKSRLHKRRTGSDG